MSDSAENEGPRSRVVVWVVLLAIVALVTNGVAVSRALSTWQDRGDFGSMFGLANALFSGLALAGVIYTLTLQRIELGLQREELRLTRDELRRSADAQERTEQALAEQGRQMQRAGRAQVIAAALSLYAIRNPPGERLVRPARDFLGISLDVLEDELQRIFRDRD
jgi:hypothetical protein